MEFEKDEPIVCSVECCKKCLREMNAGIFIMYLILTLSTLCSYSLLSPIYIIPLFPAPSHLHRISMNTFDPFATGCAHRPRGTRTSYSSQATTTPFWTAQSTTTLGPSRWWRSFQKTWCIWRTVGWSLWGFGFGDLRSPRLDLNWWANGEWWWGVIWGAV